MGIGLSQVVNPDALGAPVYAGSPRMLLGGSPTIEGTKSVGTASSLALHYEAFKSGGPYVSLEEIVGQEFAVNGVGVDGIILEADLTAPPASNPLFLAINMGDNSLAGGAYGEDIYKDFSGLVRIVNRGFNDITIASYSKTLNKVPNDVFSEAFAVDLSLSDKQTGSSSLPSAGTPETATQGSVLYALFWLATATLTLKPQDTVDFLIEYNENITALDGGGSDIITEGFIAKQYDANNLLG
jgi:hypothetical protein